MRTFVLKICSMLFAFSFVACALQEASVLPVEAGPLRVAVTFYPNEYLVERIGADAVEVFCDVPSEADALFWVPSDEQLACMHSADLIVLQGTGLERWVERADLPMSRVLVATSQLAERALQLEAGSSHSHGSGEKHVGGDIDPHIWLDPENAKVQAATIRDRLCELMPEDAEEFSARYAELAGELDELSLALRAISVRGESLFASHPAYAYLTSRFGLKIESFDFDPSQMPTPDELAELAAALNKSGATTMLWESEPLPAIAERLRSEFGLESLVFSPCELLNNELRAAGENYLSVQRANVARLR